MPAFAYVGCRTTRERGARGEGIQVYQRRPGIRRVDPRPARAGDGEPVLPRLRSHGALPVCRARRPDRDQRLPRRPRSRGSSSLISRQDTGGRNPVHLTADPSQPVHDRGELRDRHAGRAAAQGRRDRSAPVQQLAGAARRARAEQGGPDGAPTRTRSPTTRTGASSSFPTRAWIACSRFGFDPAAADAWRPPIRASRPSRPAPARDTPRSTRRRRSRSSPTSWARPSRRTATTRRPARSRPSDRAVHRRTRSPAPTPRPRSPSLPPAASCSCPTAGTTASARFAVDAATGRADPGRLDVERRQGAPLLRVRPVRRHAACGQRERRHDRDFPRGSRTTGASDPDRPVVRTGSPRLHRVLHDPGGKEARDEDWVSSGLARWADPSP